MAPGATTSVVTSLPNGGMHLVDASIAMGNLVDVVQAQADGFDS
jgi:hypothetical protein